MLINFAECKILIKQIHNCNVASVMHIGAHIGEEILSYFMENVTQVIWFEANSELIPQLELNLTPYKIDQKIFNCALWDKDEPVTFNITNNLQSSSLYNLGTHSDHYPDIVVSESRTIDAFRVDTLVSNRKLSISNVNFINIDTQGAELSILKGFGTLLSQSSIYGIYLEVNKEPLYEGIPLISEIDNYLLEYGFHRIITSWSNAGWGDAFYLKERISL